MEAIPHSLQLPALYEDCSHTIDPLARYDDWQSSIDDSRLRMYIYRSAGTNKTIDPQIFAYFKRHPHRTRYSASPTHHLMCQAYFTVYPCNHAVLVSWKQCAPDAHPQNCNPRSLILHVTPYENDDPGLPSTCPGSSKFGRTCLIVSPHPAHFAEFCKLREISLEDAIAMAPAWIYNIRGDKIGTRARPWRLSDYIIAVGLAKNPRALQGRIQSIKREADGGQEPKRKKPKNDPGGSRDTLYEGETDKSAGEKTENAPKGTVGVVKVESPTESVQTSSNA